ncbi:ABC transporter ATP-binding protein [Clostridium perfringens]|uniref:ABC transporter ATP-binding protein n=1 Tax=Clostridium perfringens TaxID=1502 RepID=UPI00115AFDD2|nr:ABC transporter ATP-binding protein [Clostridium perfringens]ELP5179774.1 ABC transporter ATP-binding protein [Clostridium perfringens]ELP5181462.1 ABC transporter ATP-binding protein [Clostridium perfringens]ELP5185293.1 ABC transporter ATP-binding protein [Clostridium perfringens]ELP5188623.1 ABC transporter ATP-binding protein [Clostridium perfringens]MDM0666403.1 ABC transporter ATP-binding protein [Clostridium perfringens]
MKSILFLKSFISIPFKYAPLESTILVFQKIFNGIAPTLEMIAVAGFLNTSISISQNKSEYKEIFPYIIFLMLIVASNWLFEKLVGFSNTKLELKLKRNYRAYITEKIAKLRYSYIENEESWNLIFRISKDPELQIKDAFNSFCSMMSLVVRIISVLLLLFYHSWLSALIISMVSIPLFLVAIKSGKAIYEVSKTVAKERRKSDYIGWILTSREFTEERTLFQYGESLSAKWLEIFENVRKLEFKVGKAWIIKSKVRGTFTAMVAILVLIIFLVPLSKGTLSIGVFISLGYGIMDLVNEMGWILSSLIEELSKKMEYFKELQCFFELEEFEGALDRPSENVLLETIEFKNVSFKYPKTNNYILKDLSFKLQKGKHYAIVGANGSGKTTITKLLTGLYDNFEGDILINNKSIRDYSFSDLKGLTSVVYQDFSKYSISIKDNVAVGNINKIDDINFSDKITDALEIIQLKDKVDSLKDGIKTELGKLKESSIDLSGGQWQRIAMARSIVSDSELVILDEPTAALDPISESNVYENFEQISKDRTTIFISHRLGSTKLANEILVLQDGKLAEVGSHEYLINKKGIYADMYESQKEWYAC